MVDFKKLLKEHKVKGKRLGYCSNNDCQFPNPIYEIHIIESYKDLPESEQKCKCPLCGRWQLVFDLIPF